MSEENKKTPEDIKKEQEEYISDLKNFAYGAIAGKALVEENFDSANTSLEKLSSHMKWDTNRDLEGLLKATFSNEESIKTAATIYSNRYMVSKQKTTVENLWKFYDEYATKMLGDLKSNAQTEIDKFKDSEYGKLMEKYLSATEIVKSKTSNFTKEQKEKAQKDMEKYDKVVKTLEILDKSYLRKNDNDVDEANDIKILTQLYAKKEGEKGGK